MGMIGYNFTERVRAVLALARENAIRLNHEYVGTEHILLGLIEEGEGVSSVVLENLGIDPDIVRRSVIDVIRSGTPKAEGTELPYTSRAKKVLELAMREARSLHHAYVGTEHLLLGILAEEKGIAAQILVSLGCTLEEARAETLRILGTEPSAGNEAQPSGALYAKAFGGAFPRRVSEVVAGAQLLASRYGSTDVRARHLLLAILRHGEGSAIAVLDRLDVDREALATAIQASIEGERAPANPETKLTYRSLGVLMGQAEKERTRADAPLLATHHLLIAIAHGASAPVQQILRDAGLTADALRDEARRITG